MKSFVFSVPIAGALLVAFSGTARATLTSSEKGQIASYVAEARVATAERVRALVARPDLTNDESAAVLEGAVVPLAFNDARAAYFHEMLYGPASLPSRSVVAVAVTRALAARADAIVSRHEADLDQDVAASGELVRLFAFVDGDVANAGQPRGGAHDPAAGIGASSYDDAARALGTLVANHPRWLKGEAQIPAAAAPVRAQLQLALYDLTNDTTTRRFDAADRLGLTASRRAALTELGILLLDDGHTDGARLDRVRALVARMPGVRENVEAVALVDLKAPLRARGEVVALALAAAPVGTGTAAPFGSEIAAPLVDSELVGVARALAGVVVRHALEARADLRALAEKDAAAAGMDPSKTLGSPGEATARAELASAVALLAIDGQTTTDLALLGAIAGQPERVALLSDALGALASFVPPSPAGASLVLGRARDPNGTIPITNIRLAPAGNAIGFTLGGHAFTLARDDSGPLTVKRDGAPVTLAMLEGARAPVSSGAVWSGAGVVFAKMAGTPRAGIAPGERGRVRLVADGRGVDAIATAAPGDDAAVEASVEVSGEAAILLRAIATPAGFKGIGLVIDQSSSPPRASIRAWDDAGKLTELAPPTDLTPAPSYPIRISVKGMKLEAKVGATAPTTFHVDVPAGLAHGDIALAARHGGSVETRAWTVKRP
jgi:hypothetical protein